MQALLVCWSSGGVNADNATDGRTNAVGANYQIMLCRDSVVESDFVGSNVDCLAL